MKTDSAEENLSPELETYKTVISGIEFMEKYIQDADLFCSNLSKVKHFLIQSFSYIHPDFHYLSFLNSEDLEMELVKAARTLQILPINTSNKLSDVLQNDVKNFWDKFFSLIKNKKQINSVVDSVFTLGWQEEISFFKDMKGTLNYLNYEFPVLNNKKFSNSDINMEINKWKGMEFPTDVIHDKSVSFNCDEEKMTDVDIEKLIADLKKVVSVYSNTKVFKEQNQPEDLNFFHNFIFLAKNVLEYKKNISLINFATFDGFFSKPVLSEVHLLENVHFMKRCLKNMKALKTE